MNYGSQTTSTDFHNKISPEQIARRLPVDFPDDETMRISHEAIYQALFVQGRGALRRELTASCAPGDRSGYRGRARADVENLHLL